MDKAYILLPGRKFIVGTVEIKDGRFAAINPAEGEADKLILPGFRNCHGHTAMTLVRGLGSGLPLQRWLEEAIFPVEAKMSADDVYAGTLWGTLEMLAGGTTEVIDMYDFPAECERAFDELGFKGSVSRVGLSFVPNRLEEAIRFAEEHPRSHVSVHSEYLTDEKYCRGLAEANRRLKRFLHVHVSETEKEHAECLKRHGRTPIAYLKDTGLLDNGGYAAHCVYATDDDFRIMADYGIALVHNPSSNMKLGSGFARIARALEFGVTVRLGTDGCASNDNLDLFEEMHLASLIAKGVSREPTLLNAWEVLEMAFGGNAIEVGREADFCVVDLNRLHLRPIEKLENLIVYSMHASDVVETYVRGRKLYDHGKFPEADIDKIKEEFDAGVRHCHGR